MPAPNSRDVHRLAREELRPVLSRLGLRPNRGQGGGWVAAVAGERLRLRLQLSKWNSADSPNGSEFTVELQMDRNRPVAGGRLFSVLADQEREELRQIQNLVIAKLPVEEEELDRLPPQWQADRLARVTPRLAPYPPGEDVWFRYVDEDDVRRWMVFIGRVLPGAADRLAGFASTRFGDTAGH